MSGCKDVMCGHTHIFNGSHLKLKTTLKIKHQAIKKDPLLDTYSLKSVKVWAFTSNFMLHSTVGSIAANTCENVVYVS